MPTGRTIRRLLLLACIALPGAAVAAQDRHDSDARAMPGIALSRADDGRWVAGYELPVPSTGLRFERVDPQPTRVRDWMPLDPAFQLLVEDGAEVVRRRDGTAFTQVALAMKPLYVQMEKDYAPFSPFGDGGLLIHTGRFHACALPCADAGTPAWRVRLAPPRGEHAIVAGRTVAAVDFIDRDDGTNLYVGKAVPVETADVIAVIDPTMPAGIRERLASLLPRLMAFYGDALGVLPQKPMLFASRDAAHPGGGYGYQGGTLPGQVFMHVYGRHPAFDTPAFATRMDTFFAHEAAHMYQHYPALADGADAWIHEGGADALAAVALLRLGESDAAATDARVADARDACAASLAAGPLSEAGARGDFDAYYRCGFVLQMAVDATVRRASHGACGLPCVWRDFQARVRGGKPWNADTFIEAVSAQAGAAAADFLRTVVAGKADVPAGLLDDGLRAAGWVLRPAATSANAAD